jgi:DNA-binding NtrC family response regulator
MINADGIDAVPGIGTGPVSLKHIARRAAHAAEREVMLLVLERTEWNRVRAAKLLEISYRALLYKIKEFDLSPARRPVARHDRFGPLEGD